MSVGRYDTPKQRREAADRIERAKRIHQASKWQGDDWIRGVSDDSAGVKYEPLPAEPLPELPAEPLPELTNKQSAGLLHDE